jgi:hypothetical protein
MFFPDDFERLLDLSKLIDGWVVRNWHRQLVVLVLPQFRGLI